MDRRTPPHRHNTPPPNNTPIDNNTRSPPYSTETTGDPRIHRTSVLDLEQLKNPLVNQYPRKSRGDVHHREQPIAATPLETRLDHVQEMMSQLLELAQDLVKQRKKENSRRRDRSSSRDHPRYKVHPPNSVLHQEIPEASRLVFPWFKQSEITSTGIVTPAPIVQDPGHQSKAVEEISVQHIQEFKDPVADQVLEETPQPRVEANDDAGSKNQKPEVTSNATNINCAVEEFPVQKVHEFSLQFTSKEPTSKINHLVLEIQDYATIFPIVDSTESSYFVKVDCKLELVSFTLVAAQWVDLIRKDGEEMERIGVG